jgi:dephospho-CoA kinase
MKKIIGLVGETGSGKDTFCDYLRKNYKNVFCFRFSDPLSEILRIFFNEVKKEDQQWLAPILRKRFGNNILGEAIKRKIKNIKKGIIILNGIRTWEDFKMIKDLGGKTVYITADQKIRWQRLQSRGEKKDDKIPYQKFLKMEKAKTEILIPKIGKIADFQIENNGSKQNLNQEIRRIVNNII